MRKIVLIMMAAVIAAGAAGCRGPKDDGASATTAESVKESGAEAGTEDVKDSAGAPQPGSGAEDGGQAQSPSGDLEAVHQAVREAYGDQYVPNMAFDAQGLEEIFGVGKDLYEAFLAEGPMISVNVETFAAVEAREGKGPEVEKLFNEYRDRLLESGMQYPANLAKIQASQVVRYGDDVFFVMLGAPSMEAEEEGEESALESAKESNQIALDVIADFYKK